MESIEKLTEGVYEKVIPLKGNPLKSINIYVIESQGEALIIDTGFSTEEIRSELLDYIRQLDLDLSRTKLFLTHLHSDHTGQAAYLHNEMHLPVYMSDADYAMMESYKKRKGGRWEEMEMYAHMQGLDQDDLHIEEHPGYRYRSRESFDYIPKNPGDQLCVGEFYFEVIDLAGHTPGMIGLYEPKKKWFFCGDHILAKITPNITFWSFDVGDSLGVYLTNLEKVKDLDVDYVFSSHRQKIEDLPKRIEELKQHHRVRLMEAVKTMDRLGECTVREITANMHWDISSRNFDEFPRSQKWFAAGEAQAHCEFLRARGIAGMRKDEDGILKYYLITPLNQVDLGI